MISPEFVYLAALIDIIGCTTYAWATIKGHTKPNRVTWVLWTLSSGIVFLGQVSEGVGLPAVLTFAAAFGPFLVVVASFLNKNAYWKLSAFDVVCGSISLLALALWGITQTGLIAIYLSLLSDLMASLPTVVKSYQAPQTESPTTYLLGLVAGVITLLTIQNWTLETYIFPVYVVILCVVIYTLIKFPKLRPRRVEARP